MASVSSNDAMGSKAVRSATFRTERRSESTPCFSEAARKWARWPDLYVCTSGEIWPEQREYERFLVTVMNAHIGRQMRTYLRSVGHETEKLGMTCRIFSTKSNGGVMTSESASERPVDTLLSG